MIDSKKIIDLSQYSSDFGMSNKMKRLLWNISYWLLFRPFTTRLFMGWRRFVLRLFGAKIADNVNIYASARIWAPWNLEMGEYSCLAPYVDCYNQGNIIIGANVVVSQKSTLCASGHDISKKDFKLVCKPIQIESQVWIASEVFIGPGVKIAECAVVGARSAVFKNVEAWIVVRGNPAEFIKKRIIT